MLADARASVVGRPVRRSGSVANRSALHPTRLETRTKESNMCASHGVYETQRRNESEGYSGGQVGSGLSRRRTTGPSRAIVSEAEQERTRWDPKDGELCLSRTKPEETLVEVRSDSDVQIDRQTWV